MSEKTDKEKVVEEVEAARSEVMADLREAFDHALKAAREAFNASASVTGELLRQGGKLAEQRMDEAQRTLVITLDGEMHDAIGKLVTAGVFKTRSEAVQFLLAQGLGAAGDLVSKVDKVEADIEGLRAKMREIPLEGAEA